MAETETRSGTLVFAVNGERFELPTIDPSTTLLEFLRSQTRFKSAKLSCGEGCSVSLSLSQLSMFVLVIQGTFENYQGDMLVFNLGFSFFDV